MYSHSAGSQISNYAYLIAVINNEPFDHTGGGCTVGGGSFTAVNTT